MKKKIYYYSICQLCGKSIRNKNAILCYECYLSNCYGEDNNNFKHGKCCDLHYCKDCGKIIDSMGRSIRCHKCAILYKNPFKGKKHTKKIKIIIGQKSKEKFTKEFLQKIKDKAQGNRKKSINGYILIKDYIHPNRNSHNDVLEHIAIMSKIIGRPLTKTEIVHHINFIRDDNRPENLYLFNNQSEHGKITKGLYKLVAELMKNNILLFKNGQYLLNRKILK